MNIQELKKILETSCSVLVMENGKPEFVVIRYDEFLKANAPKEVETSIGTMEPIQKKITEKEAEIIEKINQDILALKQEIAEQEKGVLAID